MAAERASRLSISIHALREEGDAACHTGIPDRLDFYPRPPRGGRQEQLDKEYHRSIFLSTPSARRATCAELTCAAATTVFLSTPSARRATKGILAGGTAVTFISIHALREEGDWIAPATYTDGWIFLSTPSARRATAAV